MEGLEGAASAGLGRGRRIYGASFYETYLLRPRAARARLFRFLAAFRSRLESRTGSAPRLILRSPDLESALAAQDLDGEALDGEAPDGEAPDGEAFFLAVESLRYLRDPADIGTLWDLGVRSLQPIHFLSTPWGGSSGEGVLPPSPAGLTGLGREMLAEMARMGFILDLAHMSYRTAEDCLKAYPGPVMCSHTGLDEIRPSARNLPADLAREIFRKGGVVGVTCWRRLLGRSRALGNMPDTQSAWTRSYCETAAAIEALAPGSRVAIGSDRGAPIIVPAWFYSPAHLIEMGDCLKSLGWDSARIEGFFHGNARDFLRRSLPA